MTDIVVKTQTLPNGQVGVPYEGGLAVTGNASAVSAVTVASGSIPPGLAADTTLRLTGTPTASGHYTFTLTFTDGAGNVTSGTLTLTVAYPSAFDILSQPVAAQIAKTLGN